MWNFDGNADDIRGCPGLGEKPRRHLGEPRPCVREGALATHAPLTVDDADLVDLPISSRHRQNIRSCPSRSFPSRQCLGRRDARQILYWRSKARTLHGASIAANDRGTGPPQVLKAQGGGHLWTPPLMQAFL